MASELHAAWGDWVASQGPWHVFGALTYDPKRRWRDADSEWITPAEATVRVHARSWLWEASRKLDRRLEAGVVALEYQKNGWPHFHPLLRLSGGLLGYEFRELGGAWYEKHGYARLEEPRSVADVAAYASKYLIKDLARGDVLFWPSRGPWPAHQPAVAI